MRRMVFISNNPEYAGYSYPGLEVVLLLEGSSLDVLCEARNRIHLGWRFTHHPLYGNTRPKLQPFRTLLLDTPPTFGASYPLAEPVDLPSLDLITQAIIIYESEKDVLSYPWSVPASFKADCAFLDRELMRETLAQAGLPPPICSSGKET